MNKYPNKFFQKTLIAASVSGLLVALASCGGGGSSDSGSVSTVQMSGAVVDDFIAYATVYVDVNKNGKYDSEFEPSAITDKDGYFSVAKDGTNYCDNPASRNCLQGDAALKDGGVIRVEAGRDLLTTQLYNASMSLLLDNNTSGLKVTSISTLNQELENLTDADISSAGIPGVSTKADFQAKFNEFLGSFLGTQTKAIGGAPDPNAIDPFAANVDKKARAFKMAIHFHKLAEAIAQSFVDANSGSQLKDFLPATYRALLLNADFSNGSSTDPDPLSAISSNVDKIFNFVANETKKQNPAKSNEITALNKTLNCVLAVSEDKSSYSEIATACGDKSLTVTSLPDLKKSLFSAEVAKGVSLDTNSADRLKNAVAIRTNNTFDYTVRDYKTTLDRAIIDASGAFDPNIGATKDFEDFTDKTLKIDNPDNAFLFYFQKNGVMSACQKEGTQYNLIKGSYAQDSVQKFVAYINVLGSTYTLKNLALSGASECSGATTSCIATSYKSLKTNEYVEEFFKDSFNLTATTTTAIPTTSVQCKNAF